MVSQYVALGQQYLPDSAMSLKIDVVVVCLLLQASFFSPFQLFGFSHVSFSNVMKILC